MKKSKFILLVILFHLTFMAKAQVAKGDLIIDATGSYVKTVNSSGVSMSNYTNNLYNGQVGLSAGLAVSSSVIIGLGVDYVYDKNITVYKSFTYENTSNLYSTNYIYNEVYKGAAKVWTPHIFMDYLVPVTNKWQFSMRLNAGYGFASIHNKSTGVHTQSFYFYGPENYHIEEPPPSYISFNDKPKTHYFEASLQPTISYFITPKIGVRLALGGVQFMLPESSEDYWNISFSPINWQYGLFMRFGKE